MEAWVHYWRGGNYFEFITDMRGLWKKDIPYCHIPDELFEKYNKVLDEYNDVVDEIMIYYDIGKAGLEE